MFDSGYKSQYIGGQKEKFVRYIIQKHVYFTIPLVFECRIFNTMMSEFKLYYSMNFVIISIPF